MYYHFSLPLTITLVCLLLVSCATVDQQAAETELSAEEKQALLKKQQPAHWQQEKQDRQQIRSWEIRGRLGIQTKDDGGSMDIIWKQSADEFSIRMIAPMAAGNYHIQGKQDHAEIRYSDGSSRYIDDINDIFLTLLEVDLPTSAIKDWLRGLPASEIGIDEVQWNELGLINRVRQSGWNVEMNKYAGAKILLPHSIYISRDDDEDLDIRLVLRQWLLDD